MSWKQKDGTDIDVNDMTIEHVEKVLQMLIKKYTSFCINHGARYAPQIKLNKMTEQEKRSILIAACNDRRTLKILVMRDSFGERDFAELEKQLYQVKNN
jgi:hypothetical protein